MKKAGPGRDGRTRRRLLEVATRQFADRGFRRATVRAICREARANVAAVSYHFRDKLGLYRAVVEEAAAVILRLTDESIQAGAGLPAADRLRAFLRVHCAHMSQAGPTTHLQQLMHRELQEPTKLLSSIIDRVWRPRFEYLATVVGDLLGLPSDDERVVRSVVSIHGQLVMFKPSPAHERMGANLARVFDPSQVADHITAFSLAGLSTYR